MCKIDPNASETIRVEDHAVAELLVHHPVEEREAEAPRSICAYHGGARSQHPHARGE